MNSLKSKVDDMAKVVIPAIKQRIETSQAAEQEKFKKSHRIVLQYPLGSQVMLVKDFTSKSDEKYEGPYYVNGITKNKAYILRDHAGVLYPRDVPINQLKLISGDLPANGKENEHYEVQAVVDHKPDPRNIGQYLYLVNWKGYSDNDNTWEPIANFDDRTCVRDYWKRRNAAKELQGCARPTGLPSTINGGRNNRKANQRVYNLRYPSIAEDSNIGEKQHTLYVRNTESNKRKRKATKDNNKRSRL
ncbi:hypothetical protein G6F56_012448 [Rhizopus delemar]|nr:hypothetical protein G6F56_012448 [Rhizopus delemar]